MPTVETFDSAAEAAAAMGERARVLGGGTLLMRAVNYGDAGVERIVRVRDPELARIRVEGDRVTLGAAVTLRAIIDHPDLGFLAPVARSVGGPAVRNMGTVGGNLHAGHPYGDLTAALLALDGVALLAAGGEVPLETYLAGRARGRDVVTAVRAARPRPAEFRYAKVSRTRPKGASVMSIAAWLPGGPGRVARARVAFGAMGPTPLRARAVEAALEGARLDAAGVARALEVACDGLDPADDALASAWYRREVAPVHLRRLLLAEGDA